MTKRLKKKHLKMRGVAKGGQAGKGGTHPMSSIHRLQAAFSHHKSGRLQEAEEGYQRLLAIDPDNPDANHLLGVLMHQSGRNDQAVILIRKAIEEKANEPVFFNNLGEAYRASGKCVEAAEAYQKALNLRPDFAEAHNNLGNAFKEMGRIDDTLASYNRAIELRPDFPEALNNLAIIERARKNYPEAESASRQALQARPDYFEAYCNLGLTLYEQGKLDDAADAYEKAIAIYPDYADAHNNLGNVFMLQGQPMKACRAFDRALQLRPDYAEAYYNLGNAFFALDKFDEAVVCLKKAIEIKKDFSTAYVKLGESLQRGLGKPGEAASCYEKAMRIDPDNKDAIRGLGSILKDQGRIEEAMVYFDRALERSSNDISAYSFYLFCLNYRPRITPEEIFNEHVNWYDKHFAAMKNDAPPPFFSKSYTKRLKIGYVSGDFRTHSVAYFFEPLLRAHDHEKFEIFCYANVLNPDHTTKRLQDMSDTWGNIYGMADDMLADRIKQDGINVLVDLSGHTAANRLGVFAKRPAPIQVTWLGYPNTTGMAVMDYRLTDEVADPPGEADKFYAERLVRLKNGFLCYGGDDSYEVVGPPCVLNNYITFGSFNNLAKVTPEVLEIWAKVLKNIQGARLILKARSFADKTVKNNILDIFSGQGVSPDRIELLTRTQNQADHFRLYSKIDIALDSIFYNGTTTTFEALWMGVPVVTLRGDRHASRVGASILTVLGLTDMIASDVEEYIDIAAALASDQKKLIDLREKLRHRVKSSPMGDAEDFARKIERTYAQFWQLWCAAPSQTG